MATQATATRVGAGLSTSGVAADAAVEAAREAKRALGGPRADLVCLFLSALHSERAAEAVAAVYEELTPGSLLGCVAGGVLGRDVELEEGPGAAVWAATLPGAAVETFHAAALPLEEGAFAVGGFPETRTASVVLLVVDPFTFPAGPFLRRLNDERPGLPIVGGLATGGGLPGTQALIVDGEVLDEGAVGAVVSGIPVRTIVSQGCTPFGRESVVTEAEGNVVHELAGERALDRLREDVAALTDEERRQVARGVFAGLVIDENRAEFDYLIRGIVGLDEATGAIAVGDEVRVGQTLRFHVRDAESADRDLRERLAAGLAGSRPAGALAFTCNGRGTHMFSEQGHDARAVAEAIGAPAVAGFFCGGEIGPVGGKTFLHGFTATLAVFLQE